ncbi:MAG TPA: hypothetical protein DEA96_09610 [Leptospiraceae bacterium]|nr:hypothetical protein [Spirochaetaceae bacterium]HBS05210.1 hypothetical protein [Leptospiraceae bacterium]|tara:strand:+ start:63874 stop:64110 length:237 start_codon:yes stop_codon:yes gene_type:complete
MNRSYNTFVFVALLILIAAMYFFAEFRAASVWLILGVSAIKFALVSLEFMEVRKAHPLYGTWLLILFFFFAGGLLWFL